MNNVQRTLAALGILLVVVVGCSSNSEISEKQNLPILKESQRPHDRDGGEHDRKGERNHGEAGEESGTEYTLNETYNHIRGGVRLLLAYDPKSNSFIGMVKNTKNKTLKRVRVEVHLSNGIELGPTIPIDLGPGEKRNVKLKATSKKFDSWSAHPEVGTGEHYQDTEGHHEEQDEESNKSHN